MATIRIILDRRRKKKNGKYPVVFRINQDRERSDIPSGFSAFDKEFSDSTGLFRRNQKLNASLREKLFEYTDKIQKLEDKAPSLLSAREIKQYLISTTVSQTTKTTIKYYWKEEVERLVEIVRIGSATSYRTSLSVTGKIINLDTPFQLFGYKNLVELERLMLKKGLSTNSIAVYLRCLRAICNKVIKEGLADYAWYPFRKSPIKKTRPTPRVTSMEEIRSFMQLDVDKKDTYLYQSWCIGKMLFLLRGINLKDLLFLKPYNRTKDRIISNRAKTGKLYSIQILDELEDLFQQFKPEYTLLGIFSEEQMEDAAKFAYIYGQKRKLINKHQRKLGELAGIKEKLTTYVFRYTYSNIAKQMGYSKDLIAEALGHEYWNSVTGIYLELFDNEVLDSMHKQVCKKVLAIKK